MDETRHEEYANCSNCMGELPKRCMQDELPLDKDLCRQCRNSIPATVERLINSYDAYITKLESDRDIFKDIADDSLSLIEGVVDNILGGKSTSAISVLQLRFASENKYTKSLHRP